MVIILGGITFLSAILGCQSGRFLQLQTGQEWSLYLPFQAVQLWYLLTLSECYVSSSFHGKLPLVDVFIGINLHGKKPDRLGEVCGVGGGAVKAFLQEINIITISYLSRLVSVVPLMWYELFPEQLPSSLSSQITVGDVTPWTSRSDCCKVNLITFKCQVFFCVNN